MSITGVIAQSLAFNAPEHLILFFIGAIILTAIWGDAFMILLVAFSLNFHIPIPLTLFAGYIGSFIGDNIWFYFGIRIYDYLKKRKRMKKHYDKIMLHITRITGGELLKTLILAKFLYGTRIIAMLYFSKKKTPLIEFQKKNSLAIIPWVIFTGILGILVGLGFGYIYHIVKNIQLAITGLILFFILFAFLQKIVNKYLE